MDNPTGFLLPDTASALRQAVPPKPLPSFPPETASKYRWLGPLSDAVLVGILLMSAVGILYVLFNGSLQSFGLARGFFLRHNINRINGNDSACDGVISPQRSFRLRRQGNESDRLGFVDIWYCDNDGSNCTRLTSLHGTAGTVRWSPDGRRIAFEFQSQHYYDVYVLEVPDGRPRRLLTFPEGDNGAPNWSRDGKWIYFYSSHEKGPLQLWKVAFQGGTPVRVTRNGGVYATESEDGRFLYFSKMEQPGIWKMPLNGGEEERVLDQPEGFHWFDWVPAAGGIYFVNDSDAEKLRVEFFDFATGRRTLIDNLEKEGFGLALAPDGKSLLYSRTESEDYEIMLVKNFH